MRTGECRAESQHLEPRREFLLLFNTTSGLSSKHHRIDSIMAEDRTNGGKIGKEIEWSLVIPSITRPTWEPHALEVLNFLETEDGSMFDFRSENNSMKDEMPDLEARVKFVDAACEMVPLERLYKWATETLKAARALEDQQKTSFYEGLAAEAWIDYREFLPRYHATGGPPVSNPFDQLINGREESTILTWTHSV